MDWKAVLLSALALASCGSDPRSRALAGLDLNDSAVVEDIRDGLEGQDRSAFSTYVAMHWPGSRKFCGDVLVNDKGELPVTVADALVMTRAREEKLRLARIEAARPRTDVEQLVQKKSLIIARQEALIDRQTLLLAEQGPLVRQQAEWHEIDKDLQAARTELKSLNESSRANLQP